MTQRVSMTLTRMMFSRASLRPSFAPSQYVLFSLSRICSTHCSTSLVSYTTFWFQLRNNLILLNPDSCLDLQEDTYIWDSKGVTAHHLLQLTVQLIYRYTENILKKGQKMSESSYVFVVDTFHEHQFSVSPFCVSLILKRSAQLLDGDIPLQVVVIGWTEVKNENWNLVSNIIGHFT